MCKKLPMLLRVANSWWWSTMRTGRTRAISSLRHSACPLRAHLRVLCDVAHEGWGASRLGLLGGVPGSIDCCVELVIISGPERSRVGVVPTYLLPQPHLSLLTACTPAAHLLFLAGI